MSGHGFIRAVPCPLPTVILSAPAGATATKGKSKDPEPATPLPCRPQGVLPKLPVQTRRTNGNAAPRKIATQQTVILNERQKSANEGPKFPSAPGSHTAPKERPLWAALRKQETGLEPMIASHSGHTKLHASSRSSAGGAA